MIRAALRVVVVATLVAPTSAPAAPIISIVIPDWVWDLDIDPFPGGAPETVRAEGNVEIQFSHPTFDFGTEASPNPVPPGPLPGGPIDIEIVAMNLVSVDPLPGGGSSPWSMTLGPTPSTGQIQNLANVGGVLTGQVSLNANVIIDDGVMQMSNDPAAGAGVQPTALPIPLFMDFDVTNGPPAIDVLWMPFFLWFETPPGLPVELWDLVPAPNPWDLVGPVCRATPQTEAKTTASVTH